MKVDAATQMGAVHLTVHSSEATVTYYREIIGLHILEQTSERITLGVANQPLLYLYPQPSAVVPQKPQTGLFHFALLLPSRRDLGIVLRHLLKNNVPLGASDHLVSEALYLNDPEGNGIEIYADRPRDKWLFDKQRGGLLMTTDRLDRQSVLAEIQSGDRWQGLPAETKMGHVHLRVADIQKAKTFYIDALGFDHMVDYGQSASFVSVAGYHHHLGFNSWETQNAPPPAGHMTGLRYFEVQVGQKETIELLSSHMAKQGYHVENHPNGRLIRDPFGIGLLLT
jgi:catechol 2,3-dioxygenase